MKVTPLNNTSTTMIVAEPGEPDEPKRWHFVGDLCHYVDGKLLDHKEHSSFRSDLSEPLVLWGDYEALRAANAELREWSAKAADTLDHLSCELQRLAPDVYRVDWKEWITAVADHVRARNEEMAGALRELVELKDIKEKLERIEVTDLAAPRNYYAEGLRAEYDKRKEPAWNAARAALKERTK